MGCLALNLPSVRKNLKDLTKMFGNKDIAYAVLESNNGYQLDFTRDGKPSLLYDTIYSIVQDDVKAHLLKARVHSPEFIEKFGDWRYLNLSGQYPAVSQDKNMEPVLFKDMNNDFFMGKGGRISLIENQNITLSSKIPIEGISDEEYTKALKNQYTHDESGDISKGSVVLYSQEEKVGKNLKIGSPKTSYFLVTGTSISGGVKVANIMEPVAKGQTVAQLFNVPLTRVKKIGNWAVIPGLSLGEPEVFVTSNRKIWDITTNGVKENKSSLDDQEEYLKKAYKIGKSNLPKKIEPSPHVEPEDSDVKKKTEMGINDEGQQVLITYVYDEYNGGWIPFHEELYPVPSKEETITTPGLPSYSENDTPFITVKSEDDIPEVLAEIDAAITGGVLEFIVLPEKLQSPYYKEVITKSFIKLGWIPTVKEGVSFYSKPSKSEIAVEEEIKETALSTEIDREIAEKSRQIEELQLKQEVKELSPYPFIVNNLPIINTVSAEKETGVKVGIGKDINIGLVSKTSEYTVERAAELIEQTAKEYNINLIGIDIRSEIIDILQIGKNKYLENNKVTGKERIAELKREINSLKAQLSSYLSYEGNNPKNISLASKVATPNSLEERAVILFDSMRINPADHIMYSSDLMEGSPIEMAIVAAVPEAIVLNLPTSPIIVKANLRLYESIATSPNDPRIAAVTGTNDMDLYNKLMYDNYSTSVSSELVNLAPEEVSEEIYLNIKVPNAIGKLSSEIKSLETFVHQERLKGAAEKELQYSIDRINEKKKIREDVKLYKSVMQIKQMAETDKIEVERILNSPTVTADAVLSARKIIDTWIAISDFEDETTNYLLEEVEIQDPTIKKLFRDIAIEFEALGKKVNESGKSLIVNSASKDLGKDFTFKDIIALKTRIWNWMYKNFLSISHIDNPIAGFLMKKINMANTMAKTKAITKSRELGELYKNMKDSKFDVKLFWQKGIHGDTTGNLVTEYAYKYWNNLRKFQKSKLQLKWMRDNTFIIDPLRAHKDAKAYIDELTPYIGIDKATENINKAKNLFKDYLAIEKNFMVAEFGHADKTKLSADETNILTSWVLDNSPVSRHLLLTKLSDERLTYKKITGADADRFMVIVPRKTDDSGKDLNLYDKNYDVIKSNPVAYEFYKEALKIVTNAYNNFNDNGMSQFTLAHVDKGMMQEFMQLGPKEFAKESAIRYFTSGKNREKIIDPVTGKEVKTVDKSVITLAEAIEAEFKRRKNLLKLDKKFITPKDEAQLFTEASEEVMKGDKGDIFMALNTLNLASMTYSFKTAIKPEIDLALHYLDEMTGLTGRQRMIAELEEERKKPKPNQFIVDKLLIALNNTANNVKLKDVTEKDVQNAKDMINFFLDKEYYDLANEDRSYRIGGKLYNLKEKEQLVALNKELDVLKSKKGDPVRIAKLEEDKSSLGRYVTFGTLVQSAIDAVRFTALSWNIPSFQANLLQGQIANLIEAARGQFYTLSTLKKANGILFSDREKFNNIVKNYAILGDVMYDFAHKNPFEEKKSALKNVGKLIKPMEGNKIAEVANQGQVMVAMMLHQKLKDITTGEMVPFWDAVDNDGTIKTDSKGKPKYEFNGRTGDDAIADFTLMIREQINSVHGDYNNPKLIQQQSYGRAVLVFKTFFFDPFMARFGPKRWNYITRSEKGGRAYSMADAIKEFGLNYKAYKAAYDRGEVSVTDFNNTKVMAVELMIGVMTYVLQAFVKAQMCENTASTLNCGSGAQKYLASALTRLDQETRTFISIKGYLDMLNSPTAILRLVKSLNNIVGYTEDVLSGRGMETQQGENKYFNELIKNIPGAKEVMKWSQMDEVSRLY